MLKLWTWINDNAGAISLIAIVIPLAYSIFRYFQLKRREMRAERFKTYHNLIKQLVEREETDKPKMLDRQLAVIFELRRFHEYFEPSLRILKGLRENWSKNYGPEDKRSRLLEEMDATINHIDKKSKKCTYRISQAARGL
ncbi:MAG: hypothetical protein WC374_10785 [Phycisphaerae bacterium]|jgi:hypothetical protein